ncbi:dihydrofolate reductase family protein [Streptomyces sp. NPDC005393]|uniref:dihydrofolate reductase family protein n=1 Tax=Streptomyces sp. NPDC005393 TaxID=3157041 RepID=UPI0033BA6748
MRKLVYFVAVTLDGFIAGPDGSFDFFQLGDDYRDLIVKHFPETLPAPGLQAFGVGPEVANARFDTVMSGRSTYEIGARVGLTDQYPRLRQYVVSRTMSGSPDPAVTLISEDPVGRVRELKREEGKDIYLCGGARLARTLEAEIDELVLKVNPVAIGSGIPLFGGEFGARRFRLTDTLIGESVSIMTYARAS